VCCGGNEDAVWRHAVQHQSVIDGGAPRGLSGKSGSMPFEAGQVISAQAEPKSEFAAISQRPCKDGISLFA